MDEQKKLLISGVLGLVVCVIGLVFVLGYLKSMIGWLLIICMVPYAKRLYTYWKHKKDNA